MLQSFLTVLTMPAPSCPRRGPFQGAWAGAAMVMVWVSVLLPTPRATAHAAATAMGTTVVGARTIARVHAQMVAANTLGQAAVASLGARGDQRAMASRMAVFHQESAFLTAPSDSHHGIAYVQEVNTTSHQEDAALEEPFSLPYR